MFPVVTALWVVADGTGKTVLLGMRLLEAADSSETVVTNYKALLCGIPEYDSLNLHSLKPQMLPSAGYSTTTHQRRKKKKSRNFCRVTSYGLANR